MNTATIVSAADRRMAEAAADACAKRYGYTAAQRDAYVATWIACPASIKVGRRMLPYPAHDDAHAAALAAA